MEHVSKWVDDICPTSFFRGCFVKHMLIFFFFYSQSHASMGMGSWASIIRQEERVTYKCYKENPTCLTFHWPSLLRFR